MEKIKWKSEKNLLEEKQKIRQEVIREIQEQCKCRKCKYFKKYKERYM